MESIYVIGAQSTGKSTIVTAIEEVFARPKSVLTAKFRQRPIVIREVARTVLKTYNFTREDIVASPTRAFQLQKHILKAQFEAEQQVIAQSPDGWYITDRSGIDPIVYATIYAGEAAAQEMLVSNEWHSLEQGMKRGHVFLCETNTNWLYDDGTRLMPESSEKWIAIDDTFRRLLKAREIDYRIISNQVEDINERVGLVLDAIGRRRGRQLGEQV
jgi:nicotinamide riboside kinase